MPQLKNDPGRIYNIAGVIVKQKEIITPSGYPVRPLTVTTISTAAAVTYSAAEVLGGLILRDPNGAGRSDVTPTAAEIIHALKPTSANVSFQFTVRNTADASETITVTAGTGITLSGTMTIAQNNSKDFLAVITSIAPGAEAVTIYSLGTETT